MAENGLSQLVPERQRAALVLASLRHELVSASAGLAGYAVANEL